MLGVDRCRGWKFGLFWGLVFFNRFSYMIGSKGMIEIRVIDLFVLRNMFITWYMVM